MEVSFKMMDPLYEQRLRDEVIYLHSLWHQGPPRTAGAAPFVRYRLRPSQTTQFKVQKEPRSKIRKKSNTNTGSEHNSSSGSEWPCPASPLSTTGWPSFEPQANPVARVLSAEEQSKLGGIHAKKKALKVVHELFVNNNADDSDVIDNSSDDDDELMEKDDERVEYIFFSKVFKEDTKLREYYENNYANGEFSCLVCGALGGKKTLKKFKGCLPLVQHSITITKTKKRKSHRAFGQAVCKVLGWDIDHLPAIVSMLSDKLGEGNGSSDNKESSSMAPVNNFIFVKNDAIEGKNDEAVPESGYMGSGVWTDCDEEDMNSMMCPDAGKNLEDRGVLNAHNVEE